MVDILKRHFNIADIGGNLMGDVGARLLAKALQINNKLRTIILDRNNITLQGKHTPSETKITAKMFTFTVSVPTKDSTTLFTLWRIISACEIFHFRCSILHHV